MPARPVHAARRRSVLVAVVLAATTAAFAAPGAAPATAAVAAPTLAGTVIVTDPGFQRGRVHQPITPLPIHATDSDPNQTLQYAATGLPTGLSINSGTGVISGEPLVAGRYGVRVRVRDSTGAHDVARFGWRIS